MTSLGSKKAIVSPEDECIPEFFLASVGRKAGKGLQLVSFKSGAGKSERKLTVVEGREGGNGGWYGGHMGRYMQGKADAGCSSVQ